MQAKQHNSQPTRVILVRHGRSSYNELKLYQGSCDDSVLTETGYQQAYQTGLFLGNTNIDAVYCSPLQRTQASAREILAAIKSVNNSELAVQLSPHLKEVDLPGWQGLSFKYVREKLADEYRVWKEEPHKFKMETLHAEQSLSTARHTASPITVIKSKVKNSYPILELYAKARQFWQEILPLHAGQTILIVSHGGTIRALINTAIGIDESGFHRFQQSNCGVSMLTFADAASVVQLDAMNLTQHTEEFIPKLKDGKVGLRLVLLPVENGVDLAVDKLANYLKQIPISFCLSSDSVDVENILGLQTIPPVNIQVARQDFLSIWHQNILEKDLNSTELTTGLIVAEKTAIQLGLNEILGLSVNDRSLNLQAGKLSFVHYPVGVKSAVLQGMNI
jgi:phosphoserine phosphatase